MPIRVAILTISDAGARGERADTSGDAIAAWAAGRGFAVAARALVPDETSRIAAQLAAWADADAADLLLTTGGTGLTPRDVTPEATRAILDREAPGLAEAMRLVNPLGRLSRGVAGTRGSALVLNAPGSTSGAVECLEAVIDVVPHAIRLLAGD